MNPEVDHLNEFDKPVKKKISGSTYLLIAIMSYFFWGFMVGITADKMSPLVTYICLGLASVGFFITVIFVLPKISKLLDEKDNDNRRPCECSKAKD